MTDEILTAAGVPHRRGRYPKPPAETYAVYFENVTRSGADRLPGAGKLPGVYEHDDRVELYEPRPDDVTEAAIEAELDERGLDWTKQDREWLQTEQRYQVIYEYSYYTK